MKDNNKLLSENKKSLSSIKSGKLYINNELQKKMVHSAAVTELLAIDQKEQAKMRDLNMTASDIIIDRGSMFVGYAAQVSNLVEIRRAYKQVRLMHPEADRVVTAYTTSKYAGSHDDGEYGASLRILKFLDNRRAKNTAVFVACNFGGTLLGPRRFTYTEFVVRDALSALDEELTCITPLTTPRTTSSKEASKT